MALRKCPVCGASVKLEKLERHVAGVHPRSKVPVLLTQGERQVIRKPSRRASGIHVKRSTLMIVSALGLVVAGLAIGLPYLGGIPQGGDTPIHWHPHIQITINGQPMTIPADIGIDSSLWKDHALDAYGMTGMAPLHTHDASGTIHVESTVTRDYTLGEFFRIWGQTFDGQELLGHAAGPGHSVWMVVDGTKLPPSGSQVLRDGMQVQIVCGPS